MFGKHYETMYTGSMVGAGALAFAVMGWVIAKQRPSREFGSVVEINPKLLAFIIGEKEEDVEKEVEKMCQPDPHSRSKEEEGRKLVRLEQFNYRVVNGAKYRAMRDEEKRREYDRERKRENRGKKGKGGKNNVPCKSWDKGVADVNKKYETGQEPTEPNERGN